MSAPAVSTVKTTKSAVDLNVSMAQIVSATHAVTTVIVPVIKWKRAAGRAPRRLAYPVTAALAKTASTSLIVPLIRHAAQPNASEGTLVSANSAHQTPTVPAVRLAAVKTAKLGRAA